MADIWEKYGGHMENNGGHSGYMGKYGRHMGISRLLHFRTYMADIWERPKDSLSIELENVIDEHHTTTTTFSSILVHRSRK
jgi:hypothetical protein